MKTFRGLPLSPSSPFPADEERESQSRRKVPSPFTGRGFRGGVLRGNHHRTFALLLIVTLLVLASLACSQTKSEKIYITATPLLDDQGNVILPPTVTPDDDPTPTPIQPTPNTPRHTPDDTGLYAVQAGDTLGTIATRYGVTVEALIAANSLPDANTLEVGQLLTIPGGSLLYGPAVKLIPDGELVYGPAASGFSVAGAAKFRQGFLRAYSEQVNGTTMSGVEIIDFVATNYSVNPRLLLALLEYRGGWLTEPYPDEPQLSYPLGIIKSGREGLLAQMLDAADALN